MPSIQILSLHELSSILPGDINDVPHERVKGLDILTFTDINGNHVQSISETGSKFIVMNGDIRIGD